MAEEQEQEQQQQQRLQQDKNPYEKGHDQLEVSDVISPPSKVARLEPSEPEAGIVTMASPSPLMLGLGLGLGPGPGPGASKPAFTFMQLQELEHQALIYKYMSADLPVPAHLVLPIWKSVAASSSPHLFPTLMGYYGSLCLDYRNCMEPEPGRCRRTDGKKWRCSRDVVPDQKYCERHMHRGRNRSRKPVEAAAGTATATGPAAENTSTAATSRGATANSMTKNVSPLPTAAGLQLLPTTTGAATTSAPPPRLGFSPASVLPNGTAAQ